MAGMLPQRGRTQAFELEGWSKHQNWDVRAPEVQDFDPEKHNWLNVPAPMRLGLQSAYVKIEEVCEDCRGVKTEVLRLDAGIRKVQERMASKFEGLQQALLDVASVRRRSRKSLLPALAEAFDAAQSRDSVLSAKDSRNSSVSSFRRLTTCSRLSLSEGSRPMSPSPARPQPQEIQSMSSIAGTKALSMSAAKRLASKSGVPQRQAAPPGARPAKGELHEAVPVCDGDSSSSSEDEAKGLSVEDKKKLEALGSLQSRMSDSERGLSKLRASMTDVKERLETTSNRVSEMWARIGELSDSHLRTVSWQATMEHLPTWFQAMGAVEEATAEATHGFLAAAAHAPSSADFEELRNMCEAALTGRGELEDRIQRLEEELYFVEGAGGGGGCEAAAAALPPAPPATPCSTAVGPSPTAAGSGPPAPEAGSPPADAAAAAAALPGAAGGEPPPAPGGAGGAAEAQLAETSTEELPDPVVTMELVSEASPAEAAEHASPPLAPAGPGGQPAPDADAGAGGGGRSCGHVGLVRPLQAVAATDADGPAWAAEADLDEQRPPPACGAGEADVAPALPPQLAASGGPTASSAEAAAAHARPSPPSASPGDAAPAAEAVQALGAPAPSPPGGGDCPPPAVAAGGGGAPAPARTAGGDRLPPSVAAAGFGGPAPAPHAGGDRLLPAVAAAGFGGPALAPATYELGEAQPMRGDARGKRFSLKHMQSGSQVSLDGEALAATWASEGSFMGDPGPACAESGSGDLMGSLVGAMHAKVLVGRYQQRKKLARSTTLGPEDASFILATAEPVIEAAKEGMQAKVEEAKEGMQECVGAVRKTISKLEERFVQAETRAIGREEEVAARFQEKCSALAAELGKLRQAVDEGMNKVEAQYSHLEKRQVSLFSQHVATQGDLHKAKETISKVLDDRVTQSEDLEKKLRGEVEGLVHRIKDEHNRFQSDLSIIFPRAMAQAKDSGELSVSEARLFAFDVRINSLEEHVSQLGLSQATSYRKDGRHTHHGAMPPQQDVKVPQAEQDSGRASQPRSGRALARQNTVHSPAPRGEDASEEKNRQITDAIREDIIVRPMSSARRGGRRTEGGVRGGGGSVQRSVVKEPPMLPAPMPAVGIASFRATEQLLEEADQPLALPDGSGSSDVVLGLAPGPRSSAATPHSDERCSPSSPSPLEPPGFCLDGVLSSESTPSLSACGEAPTALAACCGPPPQSMRGPRPSLSGEASLPEVPLGSTAGSTLGSTLGGRIMEEGIMADKASVGATLAMRPPEASCLRVRSRPASRAGGGARPRPPAQPSGLSLPKKTLGLEGRDRRSGNAAKLP